MNRRRLAFVAVAAFAAALVAVYPNPRQMLQAATPPPFASPFITPPPLSATATPSPSGQLVRFSGQLLDYRANYVFFTTGDGFRTAPNLKIDDPAGGATTLKPATRVFARATFDKGNGSVVELALSRKPLPQEASYDAIKGFAIASSTAAPNPDLNRPGAGFTGKLVLVIFTAEVPPKTPFGDPVYIATDVSGWSATAIRMDRVDALHYRVSRDFASGTKFLYRFTRGSWQSAERGQNGLEVPPREFNVGNSDVQRVDKIVYHWGDENQAAPDLGGGPIPSPFNPIPFNTPPHK
ncbi:MAG: hypothetical protein GIW95_06530 [Candidatus Eremiobacteraeota bacterium]|nr:hypothetical protein [Candidatus Eremiobacteraeota bacterium]